MSNYSETDTSLTISTSNSECISHPQIPRSIDGNELHQTGSPTIIPEYNAEIRASNSGDDGVNWNGNHDIEYWLPDNLGSQAPFGFPESNIYIKPALPPIVPTGYPDIGFKPHSGNNEPNLPPSDIPGFQSQQQQLDPHWPPYISEASLIPWIDVYFDRLHPTLPVLNKSALFTRILMQEHRHDAQFSSMLLSLCAFALTQPINISEQLTSSSRTSQARLMMNEATKLRSSSDFGEHPTLEAILTSFFLFACLFGSNQHNAAWLRLREAVDLALTLRLNDPDSYRTLSPEEKSQRLQIYLVLSVTERYAKDFL